MVHFAKGVDRMSRLARTISESGVYHVLFRGVNQQNIFEEDADFNKLTETIATVKRDLGFEIYAYCFKREKLWRYFFDNETNFN